MPTCISLNLIEENFELPDQFLSEGDLSLRELTEEELIAHWNLWLEQAQVSNDRDKNHYYHSAFMSPDLLEEDC